MKARPVATLVVPLEVEEWFHRFCERYHLTYFEDRPSDSYQARMAVCRDEEAGKLKRQLKEIHSHFDEIRRNPIVSSSSKSLNECAKTLTRLQGVMYGYPECCIEFHAENGPSSRARAYEEFIDSGRDQLIPFEFWAVAHAPCSSTCPETLKLGRRYLDAIAEFSQKLRDHIERRLLLPRFYQTGGGRFIDLRPLDYGQYLQELTVSKEQFERDAFQRLPEPIDIVLCEVPNPYVLVATAEEPPYKMSFPNPDMIGTMWLAYTPGFGAYMMNARTGELALYISSDKWIQKVDEEWMSRSNFRIYRSIK